MKNIISFFKWIGLSLAIVLLFLSIFLRLRYGGGKEYPDISGNPIYGSDDLELVASYGEPIGMWLRIPIRPDAPGYFYHSPRK